MSYTYSAAVVRVTWGVEPSTDDKLRVDTVNLSHGRSKGLSDLDTIRRVLAVLRLRNQESARYVAVYHVEPLRSPAEDRAVRKAALVRARELGYEGQAAEAFAVGATLVHA